MKSINDLVFEAAAKKPSGIVKNAQELKKVKNQYIVGDIYDLSGDNRMEQEDTYVNTSANGFILDKDLNVYDVSARTSQGDAGRFAGGSMSYYVTIYLSKEKTIKLSGYWAIGSRSHGTDIIADIAAGYYLEDYLAIHSSDITGEGRDLAKPFIEKGDKDAKSFSAIKSDNKKAKEQAFAERYVGVGHSQWQVVDGKIDISCWRTSKTDHQEFYDIIGKLVTEVVQKTFNLDLSELNGMGGDVIYNTPGKDTWNNNYQLCVDTKKKTLVWKHSEENHKGKVKLTIMPDPVTVSISNEISFEMKKVSDTLKGWLEQMFDRFKKDKKHEHGKWVQGRAAEIHAADVASYSWTLKYTKGQCKEMAEGEWNTMINKSNPNASNKAIFDLKYLTDIISKVKPPKPVTAPKPDTEVNDIPDELPTDTKPERGKNTELSKGAKREAEGKMDAWHNGTRKQNVKNLSDAKLKLNYSICKAKGYEEEMKQLEDEAKKRELTLESIIPLRDYDIAINENIEED